MIVAALLLAAQAAPAACPTTAVPLPAELAGWKVEGAGLTPGHAVVVRAVAGAANAKRPGGAAELRFTPPRAGTWRVALDQGGWIDVVPASGGAPLTSSAHGHGPQCSGIRKLVAFELTAQPYRLKLTGLKTPTARVMLVAGK